MPVGRNDPCPCGSGKKYKKCCLLKARPAPEPAAAPEPEPSRPTDAEPEIAPPPEPPAERLKEPRPAEPVDPIVAAGNALWNEFEQAGYEARIELFTRSLDDEELMDDEMAFSMLELIHPGAVERHERDRFFTLIDALRECLPEAYEPSARYYLWWRVEDVVAAGRLDEVPAVAAEFAVAARGDLDAAYPVIDILAYHGQSAALVAMARTLWPHVRDSSDLLPGADSEFINRASAYELYDYVAAAASPSADDPALLERLAPFSGIDQGAVAEVLDALVREGTRAWALTDFKTQRLRGPDARSGAKELTEQGGRNLFLLSCEFVGRAARVEGVPFAKADLAACCLREYIRRRLAGFLAPRREATGEVRRSRGGRRWPTTHLLCPDRATLDRYLAGLLGFLSARHHAALATFELTPAWLRFLESRGLLAADVRQRTLDELRPLAADLRKAAEAWRTDPALAAAMARWPEGASAEERD